MNVLNFRRLTHALFSVCLFFSLGATASVVTGNSQGNIIVEEFFDYQCPHCRIMLENTEKLARNNSEIKLVTRVVPLLDGNSWTIARAALAARKQGKYSAFHRLLMQQRQYIAYPQVMHLAKMAGIDVAQLQRDMRSKSIASELNENIKVSRDRGIEVIPALFAYRVNNRSAEISVVGDKSYSDLQNAFANL